MNKDFWEIPWLSTTEKVRLHILYMSCIRFVVEKYGGIMETDRKTCMASIRIPKDHTVACFQELKDLNLVKHGTMLSTLSAHL
ncbi:MAG: hypothetical protein JRD47_09635 [Deltaproteobacteria bacterium]|nr:hypothetical protein [Deltaproteobacteria bacterium]MBW2317108.1 hypothetical protein [Deltaproteobacteria bacterium]MBW2602164.1 hypothetical protein [Deltaproteobacteria bacterium]